MQRKAVHQPQIRAPTLAKRRQTASPQKRVAVRENDGVEMSQNRVDLLQVNSRQPLWKCESVVLNKITRDLNVLLKCFTRPRTSKWIKQTLYLQVLKTLRTLSSDDEADDDDGLYGKEKAGK